MLVICCFPIIIYIYIFPTISHDACLNPILNLLHHINHIKVIIQYLQIHFPYQIWSLTIHEIFIFNIQYQYP